MALIDHIHVCNNAELTGLTPFVCDGDTVGYVPPDRAADLARRYDIFVQQDGVFQFRAGLDNTEERSVALSPVIDDLAATGAIPAFRRELYRAARSWDAPTRFVYDRSAAPFFGLRSYGVHINGFIRRADGLHLWIARRAADRRFPNMLDNTVAGGQPADLTLLQNVVKECAEEANIPDDLARTAQPVSCISYAHAAESDVKPDCMFCYDIELPESFTPENTDGEVAEFMLWPARAVLDRVRETMDFKFNCSLVLIDFFLRHGVIDPDTEPDYQRLVTGLRRGPA
ncbi:MAG: DUF4743 domain-containing protein [Alphaproteobacteria bacterium]|nr:DUF4743 domain-containing protein [Alphaproteobacteria bacterium]